MHWLVFVAYFLCVVAFFAFIWKALNWKFGHPAKEPLHQGHVLTEDDFKIFGEDAPIFLWPLKEKNDSEHQ
jgi:hypothetical protein